MPERVLITGIGVVSPIGCSKETFFESCLAGRSGAVRLGTPWATDTGLASRIAAPVAGFDPVRAGLDPRRVSLVDRTTAFALGAAREALADAGLVLQPDPRGRGLLRVEGADPHRLATIVGSGVGGLTSLEVSHAIWRETRSKIGVKRYSLPMLIPNAAAAQIAMAFGARGECKSISTACASGTMAIGDGMRLLLSGEADIVLAGGAEGVAADADAYALMGFERLKTLSTRNDEPERASRPFDLHRDGFVLGEGAAILILEREAHALARGASGYAAVTGYATNCDALSMMQPDESGETIASLIRSVLASARLGVEDVEYVSAHGTSTRVNDALECKALRMALGRRCDSIQVTALKSMTGHAIAASGPMEIAAAALSLDRGVLTPTINYDTPDPECDVPIVANRPRRQKSLTCLKLSYGFGGHNAAIVLTAPGAGTP